MSEVNLPTAYERRIVAFIDILGFTDFVKSKGSTPDGFNTIYEALKELKEEFNDLDDRYSEEAKIQLRADTQTITASDSIVISRRIDEKGGVYYMLSDCADAIHTLIRHGFLCRGSVVIGDVCHRGNFIFGPAYLEAVEGEKSANYPLIKFKQELFDLAKQYPGPANSGEWEANFVKEHCKPLDGSQGYYYLDYFTDFGPRYGPGEGGASLHYENLRKILVEGVENQNLRVFEKYRWAAEHYNRTAYYHELAQVAIPSPPPPKP